MRSRWTTVASPSKPMDVRAWMPRANGFDPRSGNLRCRLEDRGDLGMSLTEQRDMVPRVEGVTRAVERKSVASGGRIPGEDVQQDPQGKQENMTL